MAQGTVKSLVSSLNSKIETQSIINSVTFNISYESNHSTVRKSGNIVLCNIVFTTPDTVEEDLVIATLPFNVANSYAPLCNLWDGGACGIARIHANQIILAATGWLPHKRVMFNAPLIIIS